MRKGETERMERREKTNIEKGRERGERRERRKGEPELLGLSLFAWS